MRNLAVLGLFLLVGACTYPPAIAPASWPPQVGYVLSGQNVAGGFSSNALTIFDLERLTVLRTVPLPHSWAKNLAVDPEGNVWIGYSGDMLRSDDRVEVYSPQGELRQTLHPCTDPEAGISFAAGRAFIACAENGLRGQVVVINRKTWAVEKRIGLQVPDAPLVLVSSAADETAVLVLGLTSGPEEAAYSVLNWIDPQQLTLVAQYPLGKNTDVWRILPAQGKFYLLNVASYRQERARANDVLVVTPGTPPEIIPLVTWPAPLWGAIADGFLYAYHNPTWNSTITDPHRWLSRLDLSSGQVLTWTLPEGWDAADLALWNDQVILAHWEYWSGDRHDGLYRFDPQSGQLHPILPIPDASAVWVPRGTSP